MCSLSLALDGFVYSVCIIVTSDSAPESDGGISRGNRYIISMVVDYVI